MKPISTRTGTDPEKLRNARLRTCLAAALLGSAAAASLGLATNPGYFSHDELQWAHFASAPAWGELPWNALDETSRFQYRPLTFNLWLLISRLLFGVPQLMHLVFVALGLINALLLAQVLRRAGGTPAQAMVASALFLLSPYATYVHGWVATLADLLWVGLGLLAVLAVASRAPWLERAPSRALAVAAITAIALLAKESALSIPCLLAVGAAVTRDRRWLWALAGALVVASAYLALRAALVLQGAGAASGYAWSVWEVPRRWLEYLVFAHRPGIFEINALARVDERLVISALVVVPLYLLALGARRFLVFALAAAAVLGPVLILASGANQYGYALAALTAGALVLAWRDATGARRAAIVVLALLASTHGVRVGLEILRVGELQARFSPALAAAVQALPPTSVLVLHPACQGDDFVYKRLTSDIPSWRGVPIGDRVRLVEDPQDGSVEIACDGSLEPPLASRALERGTSTFPSDTRTDQR